MNNTEKLLIEILSAFANGRAPEITTEYDATKLYDLAKAQSVSGIVGYMLHKYDEKEIIKADKRFADIFDKTVTQLVRKELYAHNLLEILNKNRIPHIIFKGLVVKDFYPVPELRTFGDVDIIISEKDREKTHRIMCGLGYKWELMDGGDVYAYKKGAEHYELHTTLNSDKTRLSEQMNNFWDYTKPVNGFTYEFENEFHLCYLVSHIDKHVYSSGAGIRMYLDIALFLKKFGTDLDFEKIREILKECDLEKFFDSLLFLCDKWFELEVKPCCDMADDVYEGFCRFTFRGGVFGKQSKEERANTEIRQSIDRNGKSRKLLVMISHIFPPYREVKRLYPFFNGKPCLLPAGWVVHWFKASRHSGLKNIKRIAKADVSKAQSEKELLDKIGSKR